MQRLQLTETSQEFNISPPIEPMMSVTFLELFMHTLTKIRT